MREMVRAFWLSVSLVVSVTALPAAAQLDPQSLADVNRVEKKALNVQNQFTGTAVLSGNIVGEVVGSDHPEQILVIAAHLDSWDLGTGATDDGFGVAAVLGAAKAIIASGVQPKRTLRFILFTGEEQGILGSRAYVKQHRAELPNTLAALAVDWGGGPITSISPARSRIGPSGAGSCLRRVAGYPARLQPPQSSGF